MHEKNVSSFFGNPLKPILLLLCTQLVRSENTQSQSSQLAEPLWTDPDVKRGINVRELISNLKKRNAGGE